MVIFSLNIPCVVEKIGLYRIERTYSSSSRLSDEKISLSMIIVEEKRDEIPSCDIQWTLFILL